MVLILKTELGGDLRRIPLHNDFLTFDELHLMLCRVYSVDIDDDDKVKYKDLDGDWITIADSNDLQLAIQTIQEANQKTLRLKIGSDGTGVSNEVIQDLRNIRDMSIGLIDRLASGSISSKSQPVVDSVSVQPVAEEKPEVVAPIEPVVEKLPTHEIQSFDPIQNDCAESVASLAPSSASAIAAVETAVVEPVQVVPVQAPKEVTPPVAPVQPTPIQPTPIQATPIAQEPTPVPEPVAPQPIVSKPVEPSPASFFGSNASVNSGDTFSMGQSQSSKPPSTAGSLSGSAAPTPQPVLPPSMSNQGYSQLAQPEASQAAPQPVVPQSVPQATLHGQQQAAPVQPAATQPTQTQNYYQQQQQYAQQYAQQQAQYAAQQQAQQQQQQYTQQYAQLPGQQAAQGQPQQQMYQNYQQGYQQQQQPAAPPSQSAAPPSGPPQGMPAGGYRLNRNQRMARPGYQ